MLVVALWCFILFVCWNHRLYKAYAQITWKTLYGQLQPVEWRDYTIYEHQKTSSGWIQ